MRRRILLVIVVILVLAGCAGTGPGGTQTSTTTVSPEPAPTPTATETPITNAASPTPTSTGTSMPSDSSSTPTTTQTPTPSTTTGLQQQWNVDVVRVIDGDTLEVEFPDGHTEDVRLLGVDTPEVHVDVDPEEFEGIPDTEPGRDWLRDWGHKASEFARNQVSGQSVTIATDTQADRRGSYGRLLVYVYVDGENFNRQLIDQGYARMYDSSFSKRDAFESAEATAQANGVGLWNFETTTTTRPMNTITDGGAAIDVVEIHEDAEGNDHENPNDEYIVLKNSGSSTIDMTGWTMQDEADNTFRFPTGFTLGPGETVTIRTGVGTNTDDTLYWGSESAIWNNNGDTIILEDSSGNVVLTREYT